MTAPWLPTGFHTITPNIIAEDAERALDFLKRAFGATENYRLTLSNGSITHCEVTIGDSIINVGGGLARARLDRSGLRRGTRCTL